MNLEQFGLGEGARQNNSQFSSSVRQHIVYIHLHRICCDGVEHYAAPGQTRAALFEYNTRAATSRHLRLQGRREQPYYAANSGISRARQA